MQAGCFRSPTRCLIVIMGLWIFAAVQAQTMADPTRPPSAWIASQSQPPSTEAMAEQAIPGVQIVVISPSRKFVMVNGEAVHPGESYNGSRLVAITHDGVVWRREGTNERTSMIAGVRKTVRGAEPTAGKAKSKKKTVNGEVQ